MAKKSKKKRVDVLFMPAPLWFRKGRNFVRRGDETSIPPLGLMYMAAYLNSKGYNCRILDIGLKAMSLNEVLAYVKKLDPRVVGISILTGSTITAVPLAKAIKKKFPKIVVGCGGTHICVDPTFIKRYPYFDFGIKGEGELVMHKIMKKLDKGQRVAGLYNGSYVKDLNSLPFPDYGLVDFKEYGHPQDEVGKRETAVSIMSSRGCPFNCSFCCKSESRRFVRFRTPDNIVDEIEKNQPISQMGYSFVDDTLTINRKVTTGVCEEIIRRNLKISWIAMTRADCMDLKLAKLMKKAGCRELLIGVESGDPRIRNKVVKKKVSDKDIFETIKICRQAGIRSTIFLMLGFPTEGKKEIEKTVNYALDCKADLMGIHLTTPLPGSELFFQAIKEKIIPADLIDKYVNGELGEDISCLPVYVHKKMTREYLEKARARAVRQFYLSPAFIFRLLIYYLRFPSRIKYDRTLYKNALPFLLSGRSKVQLS